MIRVWRSKINIIREGEQTRRQFLTCCGGMFVRKEGQRDVIRFLSGRRGWSSLRKDNELVDATLLRS